MRRVQKAAAVLAALALTTALAVPVWAENTATLSGTDNDNEAKIEVKATYSLQTKYHVDIKWDDMSFTYTPGEWKPETDETDHTDYLQYVSDDNVNVGWNNGTNAGKASRYITVTNKSNANVNVGIKFELTNGTDDLNYNRVDALFFDENMTHTGSTASNMKSGSLTSIWMQRADANVLGSKDTNGQAATAKQDTMGYNIQGAPSTAKIGVFLIGRPAKAMSNEKIGTITLTLSDGGDSAPVENKSKNYMQDLSSGND